MTAEAIIESVHKSYDSVSIVVVRREGRDQSNNEAQIESIVKEPGFYAKAAGGSLDDDLSAVTKRIFG